MPDNGPEIRQQIDVAVCVLFFFMFRGRGWPLAARKIAHFLSTARSANQTNDEDDQRRAPIKLLFANREKEKKLARAHNKQV